MKTYEFEHYKFNFDEFNKPQSVAIPYTTKDVNLVVSSNTATGKTAIAIAAFSYELKQSNKKMVYISPLKSLSSEKFNEWSGDTQLAQYGISIDTSDYECCMEEFETNRILILTNEAFDSKTRNKLHHEWIKNIGCLVIDEAHLLGQKGRGDKLEATLMRFTLINPNSRIIFLSATMSNVDELAKWLKSLNNKSTIKVVSNWRPVKLNFNFNIANGWNEKIEVIKEIIEKNPYEKIIVFVGSKKFGKELVKQLKKSGVYTAFHNASLGTGSRSKIEKAFVDQYSGMQVLVSTSTLSCGVNV